MFTTACKVKIGFLGYLRIEQRIHKHNIIVWCYHYYNITRLTDQQTNDYSYNINHCHFLNKLNMDLLLDTFFSVDCSTSGSSITSSLSWFGLDFSSKYFLLIEKLLDLLLWSISSLSVFFKSGTVKYTFFNSAVLSDD